MYFRLVPGIFSFFMLAKETLADTLIPGTCPTTQVDTLQLFGILGVGVLLLFFGLRFRNTMLIFFSGLVILFGSFPLYGCIQEIGFLFSAVGIICLPMSLWVGRR